MTPSRPATTEPPRTAVHLDPRRPYGRADLQAELALVLDYADDMTPREREDTYRIVGEMLANLRHTLGEVSRTRAKRGIVEVVRVHSSTTSQPDSDPESRKDDEP